MTVAPTIPRRPLFLPFAPPALGDEEINEVVDTLRSQWITTGPKTKRFEAEFAAFLDDHIFGVKDFAEYLDRCGGLPRLQHLRQRELLLHLGK